MNFELTVNFFKFQLSAEVTITTVCLVPSTCKQISSASGHYNVNFRFYSKKLISLIKFNNRHNACKYSELKQGIYSNIFLTKLPIDEQSPLHRSFPQQPGQLSTPKRAFISSFTANRWVFASPTPRPRIEMLCDMNFHARINFINLI